MGIYETYSKRLKKRERAGQPDAGSAVGRLAHDLEVVLRLEDHPEPGAEQQLVVHQSDPDHAGRDSTGSVATTS